MSPAPDLNLLMVLNAVLSEGSVAKAADRLHVTPSAVSNALARLRVLMGDPLVTKKGRGIVPTPRALELAPQLAKSLRELHDVVHAGAFNAAVTTRRFTIALSDVGQIVLLPRIAELFTKEMPQASLRAVGIDSLILLGGLASTEVDLVIGPDQGSADIHSEPLFEQRAVLICRARHPALKSRSQATSGSALRHVAVDLAPNQGLRNLAGTAYEQAGVSRHIAMIVPTFSAAAAIVAATDLVATVPESLYTTVGRVLHLATLPLPMPPFMIASNMCWHTRTHSDATAAGFRDIVRRAVASTQRRAPTPGARDTTARRRRR
jgi:DNA-binding transcriptional LysR family regulator